MTPRLKIAIIGYGKMGREIEKQAIEAGHTIEAIVDCPQDWKKLGNEVQVAIEFSTPTAAPENILRCFDAGIPVVCGTTAWHNQLPQIMEECNSRGQTLLYASNFSLGVNIFFEINKRLADLTARFGGYVPAITEIHHTQKIDSPSGTAIVLANQLIESHPEYNGWQLGDGGTDNGKISIHALRVDKTPGTHEVLWSGNADDIEIKHIAHNRSAFAQGALLAANWVHNKKGVFTMKDILNL
ncbi:MAG TPA: 4-hydroxy-tetrahydrodipicolinate reductase [Bacteroidales bacterium]|nr:4-hydroxy-tetrahydrodipicolinate reductase [Bacteroidales bacterium]